MRAFVAIRQLIANPILFYLFLVSPRQTSLSILGQYLISHTNVLPFA